MPASSYLKRLVHTLLFLVSAAPVAFAQDPAPAAQPADPPAKNDTVHGYSTADPDCLAWSNGCVICARDENRKVHCSTPGIACIAAQVTCKVSRSK